jgi:sialate O-acetylesterase
MSGVQLKLVNILVGDVWLCSGQSNMAWILGMARNGAQAVAEANDPGLRFMVVEHKVSRLPADDVSTGNWQACDTNTARQASAVAYFFGRKLRRELNVPVGLLVSAWGGTKIEPWTSPAGYDSVPSLVGKNQLCEEALKSPSSIGHPSSAFNAMIAPLSPFAIRGFIWYQGESNVSDDGLNFADRQRALINGWRLAWKDNKLPFYMVQICPYLYSGQNLQFLWMAQSEVVAQVPHTGMAITTDVGELQNIHPLQKEEVGERLALLALAKTYGRSDSLHTGPIYRSRKVEGRKIRIRFDQADGGLVLPPGQTPGTFEIAGADLDFVPAQAAVEGDSVLVWSDVVSNPREVRFGWTVTPATNLVNRAGIPVMPFWTDMKACHASFALTRVMNLHETVVPATDPRVTIREVVTNLFPKTVTYRYQWQTGNTAWKMEPAGGELTLAGGGAAELVAAGVLVDKTKPLPLPVLVLRASVLGGEGVIRHQLNAWFQRLALVTRDGPQAKAGEAVSGFGDARTGAPMPHDTSFRAVYDSQALHLFVTAHEPDMKRLVAKVTERDGPVWKDDSLEVYLLPGSDLNGRYYHLVSNAEGAQYDGMGGPGCGAFGDPKWNGEWQAIARKDAESYTVEFVIPYKALGVSAPAPGTTWVLNICRNRHPRGPGEKLELSSWSQTAGVYHTPSRFGVLLFR